MINRREIEGFQTKHFYAKFCKEILNFSFVRVPHKTYLVLITGQGTTTGIRFPFIMSRTPEKMRQSIKKTTPHLLEMYVPGHYPVKLTAQAGN